jgi:DNA-binding NtrC family response regulator
MRQKPSKQIEDENLIIGKAYDSLKEITRKYSEKEKPVLFIGETGTGKELLVRHFVKSSPRAENIFLSVNCAGVDDGTLISEIFGHVKGSFTGALKDHRGKIEACNGGILFLDEIGDASIKLQAALLRFLEYKTFFKLGSNKEEKADVLIVAATNKPQALREDLKYRFHLLQIPPMQKMDIPLLVKYFFRKQIKKDFLDVLINREYPGNIRELFRYCDSLLVQEGENIFDNKNKEMLDEIGYFFDYDRYINEIGAWNKFIQPIIEKHRLIDFKYQYQPWDDNWTDIDSQDKELKKLFTARRISEGALSSDRHIKVLKEKYSHGFGDLSFLLLKGFDEEKEVPNDLDIKTISPKEILPKFKTLLRESMATGTLPYLLKTLYQNKIDKRSEQKKPELTPLLDLIPAQKAEQEFTKLYLQYHIRKNENNIAKTAKELKMKPISLKQKLKRLKMNII